MNKDSQLIFEAYQKSKLQAGNYIVIDGSDWAIDHISGNSAVLRQIGTDINKVYNLADLEYAIENGRATLLSLRGFGNKNEPAVHVPRNWEKKPKMVEQSPVGNHNVARIVKKVEQHLGDVIDAEMTDEEQAEECWTLCIDAAHDLGLKEDHAIYAAKEACKQLGYTKK